MSLNLHLPLYLCVSVLCVCMSVCVCLCLCVCTYARVHTCVHASMCKPEVDSRCPELLTTSLFETDYLMNLEVTGCPGSPRAPSSVSTSLLLGHRYVLSHLVSIRFSVA